MKHRISGLVIFLVFTLAISGCAGGPKAYRELDSTSVLQANPENPAAMVYKKVGTDGKKYKKFMIDPIEIYRGADAEFRNVSIEDQKKVADFIHAEYTRVLSGRYEIVMKPGRDVLRLRFTLAGLELARPVMATATHIIPVGLALNLGKSAAGMSGSFMGSVTLVGEFYDGETNTLVYAFLVKKTPDAMDMFSVFTGLDASKKAITGTAEKFREAIDKIQGNVQNK